MYVHLHGYRLWVETAGTPAADRPTVLLLHGFPDSSSLWSSQIAALAAAGHHVVVPDMLGYGKSDKPRDPRSYALKKIVSLLCALLDTSGVTDKVVVVGHDWGAATAWALATLAPERVEKLVVLSVGHPGAGAAVDPVQRAHWWYMLYFLLPGAEEALVANDWALFKLVMGAGCAKQQVQAYVQQLSQPGALIAALNWYRANTSAHHFGQTQPWPVAAPINCPVLGVWSTKDTALREPQMLASEQFVAPGHWQYVKLEGVGHWIPREAPEMLNQLLLQFTADGVCDSAAANRELSADSATTSSRKSVGTRSRL